MDLGRRLSRGSHAFSGIDPFKTNTGQASLASSMGAVIIRFSNMIAVTTEPFDGLSFLAGYSNDTGLQAFNSPLTVGTCGASNKFCALSLALRSSSGPTLIAALFDTYLTSSGEGSSSVKQWNIGSAYNFKVVTLHAALGQNSDGRVNGWNILDEVNV